jgi:hypothetical protein
VPYVLYIKHVERMTYVTRIPRFLRQFAVPARYIFNLLLNTGGAALLAPPLFSQFLGSECNAGLKDLPAILKGRIANPRPASTLLPSGVVACHENFNLFKTQRRLL